MSTSRILAAILFLVLGFTLTAGAAADDPTHPSPSVGELVSAANQNVRIPELVGKLEQLLAQSGPEADQIAGELAGSLNQVPLHPDIRKYLQTLVDQKKNQLAAQLLLKLERAFFLGGAYGHVVIGQVVVEDGKLDPKLVMAQMPILEEGYFVDNVQSLDQPLCFRAQGYCDLNVPLNKRKPGAILDKVVLKPLPPEEKATLKGKLVLDGHPDAKMVHVYVSTAMGPLNTLTGGYAPRARWPESIQAQVDESGNFTVEGLNPSEISVTATAEGYVTQSKRVQLTTDHPTDLGELRLQSADLAVYIGKPAPKNEPLQWEADYAAALKRAQAEHKPMMVMITATWCGPCKLLEKETLDSPWIGFFLSKFVVVKAYEDKDVEQKYGSSAYPTLVFTDSTGNAAYKCVGYKPPFEFVKDCARANESLAIEQPEAIRTLIDKKIITLKQP